MFSVYLDTKSDRLTALGWIFYAGAVICALLAYVEGAKETAQEAREQVRLTGEYSYGLARRIEELEEAAKKETEPHGTQRES